MWHFVTCLSYIPSDYFDSNTGLLFRYETYRFYDYEAYDVASHQSVVVICVFPKKPEIL